MKKVNGLWGLFLCAFSVLFIDKNGISVGDSLLGKLGINSWSESDRTGLHISLVIALVFLLLGYQIARQHYIKKYPRFSLWFFVSLFLSVMFLHEMFWQAVSVSQ